MTNENSGRNWVHTAISSSIGAVKCAEDQNEIKQWPKFLPILLALLPARFRIYRPGRRHNARFIASLLLCLLASLPPLTITAYSAFVVGSKNRAFVTNPSRS